MTAKIRQVQVIGVISILIALLPMFGLLELLSVPEPSYRAILTVVGTGSIPSALALYTILRSHVVWVVLAHISAFTFRSIVAGVAVSYGGTRLDLSLLPFALPAMVHGCLLLHLSTMRGKDAHER